MLAVLRTQVGGPVLLDDQAAVALPAVEDERAGAHGVGAQVVAVLGGGGGGEGPPGGERQERGPRRVGLGQRVADGQVVDHLERHALVRGGRLGAGLAVVVVDVGLQRLGVERRAVVERDVGPQLQRPLREVVAGLHRLGQVRLELAVDVALHQRVVERVARPSCHERRWCQDARDRQPRSAGGGGSPGGLLLSP